MKKIIFLLFALLSLNSCSTYYYMAFSSPERQSANSEFESFLFEKENIKVNYAFEEENGKVYVEVQNNSDEPVYVDWARSSLIMDSISNSLQSNNAVFKGGIDAITYSEQNHRYSFSQIYGNIGGNINIPTAMTYIPAHTKIVYNPLYLSNFYQIRLANSSYQREKLNGYNVKSILFDQNNSPLQMNLYLTVVKDKDKSTIEFKTPFYISSIIKTGLPPSQINPFRPSGNNFYYRRASGASGYVSALALLGIISAGVAFGGDASNVSY